MSDILIEMLFGLVEIVVEVVMEISKKLKCRR